MMWLDLWIKLFLIQMELMGRKILSCKEKYFFFKLLMGSVEKIILTGLVNSEIWDEMHLWEACMVKYKMIEGFVHTDFSSAIC